MKASDHREVKYTKALTVLFISIIILFAMPMPHPEEVLAGVEENMLKSNAEAGRIAGEENKLQYVFGPVDIRLSFKLDQRLTRSMYMGDRWVSPQTYTKVQDGEKLIVEARAQAVDKWGRQVEIVPEWKAEDPSMVTVSPEKERQVAFTIHKEGRSSVLVEAGDISKRLTLMARRHKGVLLVEITHAE
jgi:hypothetical protein